MAFAGISKGSIAIVAAMVLAAERSGSAEALRQELSESEQSLLKTMSHRIPNSMFPRLAVGRGNAGNRGVCERRPRRLRNLDGYLNRTSVIAEDIGGDRKETDALASFFFESRKPVG